MTDERKKAERRVGLAKLWARAKQIVTTDPTGSDEDDHLVDEAAAEALAAQAGKLKGGLAKVAQLAAYDPGGSVGRRSTSSAARRVLGGLWDKAPAMSAAAISAVIEKDLGKPPQQLFASWDVSPLAAASIGQVHAAKLHDGTDVVVKVQYPGVAEALRADLDDAGFLRKLAGAEIGRTLDDEALGTLATAVRGELDYAAEAESQRKFARAWEGDRSVAIPRVIDELSSPHVLTMTRATGKSIVDASAGSPELRKQAALAIFKFAWGSPLAHGLVNADPNPGNFLVDEQADGSVRVWCLDYGCALALPDKARDADRELFFGLVDADDGAERFRMGLAASGLLRRTDSMASVAHRDWERAVAAPLTGHGDFYWSSRYAIDFAEATQRVLASGGMGLPASALLVWRQRLGVAAVVGMLDAKAPFRRVIVDLVGNGKRALR